MKEILFILAVSSSSLYSMVPDFKVNYTVQDIMNEVETRILKKEDFNSITFGIRKYYPLIECARSDDHLSSSKKLLESGADPNIRSPYGDTPLGFACKVCAVKTVKLLLKNKANPNESVETVLFTAFHTDHDHHYADVKKHELFLSKRKKIITLLLKSGITPAIVNNEGQTAIQVALAGACRPVTKEPYGPFYHDYYRADSAELAQFTLQEIERLNLVKKDCK